MFKRMRVAAVLGLSAVVAAVLVVSVRAISPSIPIIEVIASGLDNPRGLAIGPDGAVYVAQAGRGGSGPCITNSNNRHVCYGATSAITRITPFGTWDVVRHLPSLAPPPDDAAAGTEAIGPSIWCSTANSAAWRWSASVRTRRFAHRSALPGRDSAVSSDSTSSARLRSTRTFPPTRRRTIPTAVWSTRTRTASPCSLRGLRWQMRGPTMFCSSVRAASVPAAVFPNVLVPFGPPGNMVPMQAVPTSVTRGRDEALYVGQLTGFPFPPGGASVFKVFPGGVPTVFADGFTNIIDVKFGRDGSLYVLQISANGLLSGNPLGKLVRVATDGSRTEIAAGALIAPGGLALGADGSIYVSRFATLPGAGDVVRIRN